MDRFEGHARQLSDAAQALATYCKLLHGQPFVSANAPSEIQQARQSILSSITQIQTLLNEPADFLQQLAIKNQYLACIHWLGEFQVLACIPLSHSVPFEDVAELAGIPEPHLRRVVRMLATTGFLQEPEPDHVAHSTISSQFVTRPSYLDAAMFLAETAAPAALQMPAASRDPAQASFPMITAAAPQPKVRRQWQAYLQYGLGHSDSNIGELLEQFDWVGLEGGTVVTTGARAIPVVRNLADRYPTLGQLILQSDGDLQPNGTSPRVSFQKRCLGSLQNVPDADVYVIGLPSPSLALPVSAILDQIASELRAHLHILRSDRRPAILLLATRPMSDHIPGTDSAGELITRLHDLSLLQLANERAMEMTELMHVVNGIGDTAGCLGVVRRITIPHITDALLEVRYHAYASDQ
ncbi:uncharacterized protein N7483_007506 [Penicillium malachiteum]|uniref:uncharacterized protein n=1 Tax=Penicillium malachiteum TaxID=1324776 RepID=UPI0025497FFF|nr:uncharacterized protein N7483_007506 [Penicillium malachiteum]KAJ5726149.1 hypothetical protein N7483_007506 [Penicillium malachiteum]